MKLTSILLAVGALLTGLWAACKWYGASNVKVDLGYSIPGINDDETFERFGMTMRRGPESGDSELNRMNEIMAIWDASDKAAKLNRVAALWTAASVFLGSFSSVIGSLISN